MSHHPSNKLEQTDTELPYQSQISLRLAQYISKHDGTVKNGQLFSIYDPKAASNTVKRFSGMAIESSMMPSIAATFIAIEKSSLNKLPSYATCQNMAVSKPNKCKIAFDMVPWHKEVKCDLLQNIKVAELEWAEASNRRPEEVKNEAEILEDMQPRFRAKRRLVFATQLMQQVFQPAPAVILSSDTGSNCDGVTYFAARFSFADACLVTSNSQMPSDGNGMSPDKLKTCKRYITSDFSEAVEVLVDKVKKLEGEFLRMDKSLSFVDIKVESQELEKFSIINRFAKFHIKAQLLGLILQHQMARQTFPRHAPGDMFQHIQCLKQYQKEWVVIPCDHQNNSFSPVFLFQQGKSNADLLILRVKDDWGKIPEISAIESGDFWKKDELFFQIVKKYITCSNAIHNIARKELGEDLGGAACLPTTEQLDDLYGCGCTLLCFLGIWLGDQLQVQLYDTTD